MTVPDYQTLMRPILVTLQTGEVIQAGDLVALIAHRVGINDEDRQLTISTGGNLLANRVGWAVTYLVQAGVLHRPRRAHVQITERGQELLASGAAVDNRALEQYAEFQAFRERGRKRSAPSGSADAVQQFVVDESPASPQELMDAAVAENRAAVQGDVLARAMALDPTSFERLVVRLLGAMGYGASGRIEHSGKSGDGGFDGIISQDPLGLDRVYMQAKRYAIDNVVTRPVVQGFVGALFGAQGDRGVFITTSRFSQGAREEADKVNARIELIDGERLSELLVRHGVGVQVESTAVLHRLDEDFFEGL